jgi:ABC-2 type transport system permease protein
MISLFLHELKLRRAAILLWGFGLIFFGSVYILIFPEMFEQMQSLKDLTIYRIVGIQLGSIEGYMASVVLVYIPILIGIYCIAAGTSILAGEEDRGTLELIAALPLGRLQLLAAKWAALAVVVTAVTVIAALGNALVLAAVKTGYQTDISSLDLFTALLGSLPLALALISMGLLLGAALPNRRLAAGISAVYFAAAFFMENIAGMVSSLKPMKYLSLFTFYDTTATIFTEGPQLADILILLGAAGLFFALAAVFFQRRNITVGAWPWQRGKIPPSERRAPRAGDS